MTDHALIQAVYAIVRHSGIGKWTPELEEKDQSHGMSWVNWYWEKHHPQGCSCRSTAESKAVTLVGGFSTITVSSHHISVLKRNRQFEQRSHRAGLTEWLLQTFS